MKILIIEDEESAVQQLQELLRSLVDAPEFVAAIDNVEDAIAFLSAPPPIDLIFLDISLSDGLSFDIFEHLQIDTPVVFTTAYDQYALRAFGLNSIDYLLKPLRREKLEAALAKYHRLESRSSMVPDRQTMDKIARFIDGETRYKKNFLVPYKDRLIPVATDDFAWFELKNGIVRGLRFDKKLLFMEEKSLEELSEKLSPQQFYRANRQFLVNRKAIQDISYFFNGRLFLNIAPPPSDKVLISKARAGHFKEWMSGTV